MEHEYFNKINKCINSCETPSQVVTAHKMINIFYNYLINKGNITKYGFLVVESIKLAHIKFKSFFC